MFNAQCSIFNVQGREVIRVELGVEGLSRVCTDYPVISALLASGFCGYRHCSV